MTDKSPTTLPFAVSASDKEGVFAAQNQDFAKAAMKAGYVMPFITDEAKFAAAQQQAQQKPKAQLG